MSFDCIDQPFDHRYIHGIYCLHTDIYHQHTDIYHQLGPSSTPIVVSSDVRPKDGTLSILAGHTDERSLKEMLINLTLLSENGIPHFCVNDLPPFSRPLGSFTCSSSTTLILERMNERHI